MKRAVVLCLAFLTLFGCQLPVEQSSGTASTGRTVLNWASLNAGPQYFVKFVGSKWSGIGSLWYDYFLVVNYGWILTGATKTFVTNASVACIYSQGTSTSYDPAILPDDLVGDANFQIAYSVFDGAVVSSNTLRKSAVGMAMVVSPAYSNSGSVITTQLRVGFSSTWMAANVSVLLSDSNISTNTYQIVNVTPPPPNPIPVDVYSVFSHSPQNLPSNTHEDVILNYVTWDGSLWTTKLTGSTFIHAPNGDFTHSHTDTIINYKTWDGSNWTARFVSGQFVHAPNGDFSLAHNDSIINYITWDGTHWTADVK